MAPATGVVHDAAMDYDIELAPVFAPLSHIDVGAFAAEHEPWTNRTLTQVNDSVVRVGILEGEFHWHHHDVEDEFFLVLEGRLLIDLRDRDTVELGPHQGFTVPHGVEHRTRAPERTVVLMVEPAGVAPTGS
jgi:mannose-6-phosphate isomerase-like protein (cupin superfamily)